MPIATPFHDRTSALCSSMNYKEWSGYYAVCSYEVLHEPEYFAFRHAAGLLDVTPLFKYKVSGKDAAEFLSRIIVKNINKLKVGQVTYCCWCDDHGKVIDDGTVMRFEENEFMVTSADPSLSWFSRFTRGYEVEVEDITEQVGALALQGPTSREILKQCTDVDMDNLKFFWSTKTKIDDFEVRISRTGYTGDLGYEIWVKNEHALKLYDTIMSAGKNYGIKPAGLDALDITRIEAGLILKGVDYYNTLHVITEERKSSPYELGLGWTVNLKRDSFNGQNALRKEKETGSQWAMVGLDINWPELEAIYKSYGLPPEVCSYAWRHSVPVYHNENRNTQIGYATSGTWSPTLKKNLALTTIQSEFAKPGTKVQFEITVEHKRHIVSAIVNKPQFFDPERKRS
ncbi:MAG: hypothetical protein COC01_01260 [Bacteroidetes bacterium]|nr:MAG: hypothetical protein COC01_01260 [Bacteroidota bacterium]